MALFFSGEKELRREEKPEVGIVPNIFHDGFLKITFKKTSSDLIYAKYQISWENLKEAPLLSTTSR